MRWNMLWLSLLLAVTSPAWGQATAAQSEKAGAASRKDIRRLEERIEALERELERRRQREAELVREAEAEHEYLTKRIKEIEEQYPTTDIEPAEPPKLGGALWMNYANREFSRRDETTGGDFRFDLFRLSVDGQAAGVLVSAQYRFYSFMNVIHHGWIGKNFGEHSQVRVGITQVPFGLLPFASHSYWFGLPYYGGYEDDYDAGVKYIWDARPWNLQLAFFKNEEWGDSSKLDRYSFDVVSGSDTDGNEEVNQLNARLAYSIDHGAAAGTELGVSAQAGQLYNNNTRDTGMHSAAAVHLNSFLGPWNLQLEAARYEYDPENPVGADDRLIDVGGFGTPAQLAAEGTFGVINIARRFRAGGELIDELTCYNDFSILAKDESAFEDSLLNTLGCSFAAGPTYTYVDFIAGKNATFLNDSMQVGSSSVAAGLGAGATNDWETRFNINVEYYF